MIFRRSKPPKPERLGSVDHKLMADEVSSVSEVLVWAAEHGVADPSLVEVEEEYGEKAIFTVRVPETDEQFAYRMRQYENGLASYNHWLAENGDEVAALLEQDVETARQRLSEHSQQVAGLSREET